MSEPTASIIHRDLNLNLTRLLSESSLDAREGHLLLLACATSVGHKALTEQAREQLSASGVTPDEIREAAESAAIMGMLNVYYRTRHFLTESSPANQEDYRQAGLRMTGLARPVLGKATFELLAFAVSAINGCEACVTSHEKALRELGMTVDKIHDSFRIAAVVKGLKSLEAL